MARTVRVEMNDKGARELLNSAGIRADLLRRAERIAATAGPGMEASVQEGPRRARASVVTGTFDAILSEATDRSLTRAVDAGRG